MVTNTRRTQRGQASLTRERIVDAAIALLDSEGSKGLTFRALAERLATGAGAIYWHVSDKDDLVNAACDAVVERVLQPQAQGRDPHARIRSIALGMFDALDAHPWVGAALARSPGAMPTIRMLEAIGAQVRALGVADAAQWQAASALLHYVLGVAGQNAANAQQAQAQGWSRSAVLGAAADAWAQLDEQAFPFTRAMAGHLRDHDDRADFVAGIDLILAGMGAR